MERRYRVAVVMRRATQFDGPLFAHLTRSPAIELTVYYTAPDEKAVTGIDPEIGVRPDWVDMATSGYTYRTRGIGLRSALSLLRGLVGNRPDLIVVSGYVPLFHVLIALYARLCGVPVGLRSDTTLYHSRNGNTSLKGLIRRWIKRIVFKLYVTAHPVGTLATEYLQFYGVRGERVFRFPYAIHNEWFHASSNDYRVRRSEIRRAMGIAEDAFVVLGIMKFNEREDPITLIHGFAEYLSWHQRTAHLVLVGDGPLRGRVETAIRDKGIPNVTLPGYAPYGDLPKYYAIADVFVHPAIGESWGVSVNESMACGVPVILSDRVGSHVDLVQEGETGFVFQATNTISLARCLAKMADDPARRRAMGENARKLISSWGYEATERSLVMAARFVTRQPS